MTDSPSNCKSVMIVEDDHDVRDSLFEILEDNGYRPLAASNGKEALERLRATPHKPCLVLLDIMMPVMDGWGFRAEQRLDPSLESIPVVVLTAHANAEQAARQMQASAFLKKPVTLEALLSTVERYCGGTQA